MSNSPIAVASVHHLADAAGVSLRTVLRRLDPPKGPNGIQVPSCKIGRTRFADIGAFAADVARDVPYEPVADVDAACALIAMPVAAPMMARRLTDVTLALTANVRVLLDTVGPTVRQAAELLSTPAAGVTDPSVYRRSLEASDRALANLANSEIGIVASVLDHLLNASTHLWVDFSVGHPEDESWLIDPGLADDLRPPTLRLMLSTRNLRNEVRGLDDVASQLRLMTREVESRTRVQAVTFSAGDPYAIHSGLMSLRDTLNRLASALTWIRDAPHQLVDQVTLTWRQLPRD